MFRTEIKIPPFPFKITHSDHLLTHGSCFAEVIGKKLADHKFPSLVNPFGTIFNPISLFKLVNLSLEKNPAIATIYQNERWNSFDLHSSFSENSAEDLIVKIKYRFKETENFISKANVIILTLGSAFAYREKTTNEIVANCHKIPASNFTKELLSVERITESFKVMNKKILTANPNIRVIVTVSPVRHLKDTIQLNNVSKSILRLACHSMVEQHKNVYYFPAYEIMVDDLRDYRFYKEDMIHPTVLAEKYIWDKFQGSFFPERTIQLNESWSQLKKALDHKPFNNQTSIYKNFIKDTVEKLKELGKEINLVEEIKQIQDT